MRVVNEITARMPADQLFDLVAVAGDAGPLTLPAFDIGGMSARYTGRIRVNDADRATRRATLKVRLTEAGGHGDAELLTGVEITPDGDQSRVKLDTDLRLRGELAALARGSADSVCESAFAAVARELERVGTPAGRVGTPAGVPAQSATGGPPVVTPKPDRLVPVGAALAAVLIGFAAGRAGGGGKRRSQRLVGRWHVELRLGRR